MTEEEEADLLLPVPKLNTPQAERIRQYQLEERRDQQRTDYWHNRCRQLSDALEEIKDIMGSWAIDGWDAPEDVWEIANKALEGSK